jgi:serine/threonine-protein kinase
VDTNDSNLVGKVVSTDPAIGTQVTKNSTVNIQIGKAQQQTAVPSVLGQTVSQARQTLQAVGFTKIQFNGDSSDNALVTNQDPQANTGVDDPGNTTITLTTVGAGNNNGGNNGGTNFFGGVTGTAYRTED